jgi:methylated-DNA-[protein]-cysteine S-methyltransferase
LLSSSGIYESPIGNIAIFVTGVGVKELHFTDEDPTEHSSAKSFFVNECISQLDEYFKGSRKSFDIPLDLRGTQFHLSVWRALLLIPYGEVWSYGRIAVLVGRPKAARAVGGANHHNPVSIIVPCHRVIGGDGKLTGYGGGLWRKEWLLDHEQRWGD